MYGAANPRLRPMLDSFFILLQNLPFGLLLAALLLESFIVSKNRREVEPAVLWLLFCAIAASGVVVQAPNLSSLDGFQLATALTSELGLAATVENDANAAAVGEMWRGAARGFRTIVCLTLGTGVGGGIILDGKLWRGVNNSAGEIGHTCVDPFSDVACTCGSRGCLERFASATGIVRMTREAKTRFPDSVWHSAGQFTAADVYQAGVQGDALALEVMQRVGFYLGVALANLVNLLNPEMIVIGGGVANGWNLFADEMRKQVAERAFPVPAAQVKIVRAECGDDAGLLGAARLGFDSIAATDLESRGGFAQKDRSDLEEAVNTGRGRPRPQ